MGPQLLPGSRAVCWFPRQSTRLLVESPPCLPGGPSPPPPFAGEGTDSGTRPGTGQSGLQSRQASSQLLRVRADGEGPVLWGDYGSERPAPRSGLVAPGMVPQGPAGAQELRGPEGRSHTVGGDRHSPSSCRRRSGAWGAFPGLPQSRAPGSWQEAASLTASSHLEESPAGSQGNNWSLISCPTRSARRSGRGICRAGARCPVMRLVQRPGRRPPGVLGAEAGRLGCRPTGPRGCRGHAAQAPVTSAPPGAWEGRVSTPPLVCRWGN